MNDSGSRQQALPAAGKGNPMTRRKRLKRLLTQPTLDELQVVGAVMMGVGWLLFFGALGLIMIVLMGSSS